jgi:CubicO group peptidase (beta-lactamase class C family)
MSPVFDADDRTRLRRLFDFHLDNGLQHGAQLAVYGDGQQVVDFAGGVTGPADDAPETTSEQRFLLFSCTKPYAAVCLHHLVERGALDYDDPVREHWPEFADPDTRKADVTVRHVLSHQAGLPSGPIDDDVEAWLDWDRVVEAMGNADLQWDPGSTAAYHALNFGWLVGELVRRVSDTDVGAYAREHVFEPLGMDETYIGLPEEIDDDVATLAGFEPMERARTREMGLEGLSNAEAAELFNREDIHRAVIPASSGVGTASDMARFYACLANGGRLDGTRILEEATVAEATSVQTEVEEDGTMGTPRRYALGFERSGSPEDKYGVLGHEQVFGHGGLGSIVGWADPSCDLAMAYVTNGVRDEFEHGLRVNTMAEAVRDAFACA